MAINKTLIAPEISLSQAAKTGASGGLIAVLLSAMGIIESFSERVIVEPQVTMGYLLLFSILFGTAYLASSPPPLIEGMEPVPPGPRNVQAGLISGLLSGVLLAIFIGFGQGFNLREMFLNISPTLMEILTFGLAGIVGNVAMLIVGIVLGAAAGGLHVLKNPWKTTLIMAVSLTLLVGVLQDFISLILRQLRLNFLRTFFYKGTGGLALVGAVIIFVIILVIYSTKPKRDEKAKLKKEALSPDQKIRKRNINRGLLIILMLILPAILGSANTEVLDKIGLFLLMGLGLNIVVGFAGMLDLGYVAFYAVGAYSITVLTSPSSPLWAPQLSFWLALPIVVVIAVLAGLLVGAPVLRMRGDYLAIVTLGFGEIARVIAKSEWFTPVLGGAQGILSVPDITIGPITLHTPQEFYYPILGFCVLTVIASLRLKDSRIGRAWVAMREDETVAEVMGINVVTAKLLAFVTGAVIASFSGALFAAKIGSVFPASFTIFVSITVLVLIIVGGMGSIPGVIVGALVVVGMPELLKEFDNYRQFFYGILLVVMMRLRPEGLLPSRRITRELHEDEISQDSWLKTAEETE